jgi:filamentous hemagglutinin family protein
MSMRHLWLLVILTGSLCSISVPLEAQIVPDSTLGDQRSRLTPNAIPGTDLIDGGAQRGSNLFHSFDQFNINPGQRVYFANPSSIQNILTRVTGNSASNIQGLLGVAGNANLFLLNPNGVIFGPNAQLDIRGSFVSSTANAIQFGNQGTFSATNPTAPPLLTVQPSAFLFTQLQPKGIQNQSRVDAGTISTDSRPFGLRVGDGQSLLLVGGDVDLNNGGLAASGGRVEVGGLSAPGTIGLAIDGSDFRLEFPDNVARANASFTNGSNINVQGASGGNAVIQAQNVNFVSSNVQAGLVTGSITPNRNAGEIDINASGTVTLDQSSQLLTTWGFGTTEKGGNITVNAGSLRVLNRSEISNVGIQGTPGDITLNAQDTILFENFSGIASVLTQSEGGRAGNFNISTGTLLLKNGASVGSLPAATQGDSGDITINARDRIVIEGGTTDGSESGIISSLLESEGKGGNITIDTGTLTVDQQGVIATTTVGQGDAGQLTIRARDAVTINGGRIDSSVGINAQGNGGDITINTSSMSINNEGTIDSSVGEDAEGNGGNIVINAGSVSINNEGIINSSSEGKGNAGQLTIRARDAVSINNGGGLFSSIDAEGRGNGGDIAISAGSLSMTNGGGISTQSSAFGGAGNVKIDVRGDVLISGGNASDIPTELLPDEVPPGGILPSGILTSLAVSSDFENSQAEGTGGNIDINANSLTVSKGILLSGGVLRRGNSGDININVRENLTISDGILLGTFTFGQGNAGKISINAGDTISIERSSLSALSFPITEVVNFIQRNRASIPIQLDLEQFEDLSKLPPVKAGNANDINVTARVLRLDSGQLNTSSGAGNGGNIRLQLQDALLLRRGGGIATTAGIVELGGNGGDITIDSPFIVAVPKENSFIQANAFTGRGGNVQIRTNGLFGIQPRSTPSFLSAPTNGSEITASSQLGIQGDILITQPDVQPTQGTIELPAEPIDASNQIAQVCRRGLVGQSAGRFVVSGRGSVPPSPIDPLSGVGIENSLATIEGQSNQSSPATRLTPSANRTTAIAPPEMIEAQGWTKTREGKVVLLAGSRESEASTQARCPS